MSVATEIAFGGRCDWWSDDAPIAPGMMDSAEPAPVSLLTAIFAFIGQPPASQHNMESPAADAQIREPSAAAIARDQRRRRGNENNLKTSKNI